MKTERANFSMMIYMNLKESVRDSLPWGVIPTDRIAKASIVEEVYSAWRHLIWSLLRE